MTAVRTRFFLFVRIMAGEEGKRYTRKKKAIRSVRMQNTRKKKCEYWRRKRVKRALIVALLSFVFDLLVQSKQNYHSLTKKKANF